MVTATEPMSAAALLQLPTDGWRYELIQGELKQMTPAGAGHGAVGMNLAVRLGHHAQRQGLGRVFLAETGFLLARDPDTVRAPDIAFVSQSRLATTGLPAGYFPGAPDLAVEVVSPGDSAKAVRDKVADWLGAGAQAVWVVYPARQTVQVHAADGTRHVLGVNDQLTGGSVVPGFAIPVAQIFE